ncbi:SufE-like protein 2 chloroplastic, partial [Bienertia sinuspersici]
MTFITEIPTLPSSLCPCSRTNSSNLVNPPSKSSLFTLKPLNFKIFPIKISNSRKNPTSINTSFCQINSFPDDNLENPHISSSGVVSLRLKRLVSEFRSLPEPIDRVKRLLDYATILPQLSESTRLQEYRVPGCAAQVWLEVGIDEMGRMRFRADSDSEITKGFCSCLIFLLDDMNVGLPVRSRVNSWHNVLVSMQERTKSFLVEQDQELSQSEPLDTFLPLPVSSDSSIFAK